MWDREPRLLNHDLSFVRDEDEGIRSGIQGVLYLRIVIDS